MGFMLEWGPHLTADNSFSKQKKKAFIFLHLQGNKGNEKFWSYARKVKKKYFSISSHISNIHFNPFLFPLCI